MKSYKPFTQGQLETICRIIAETNSPITGSDIGYTLESLGLTDPNPELSKWKRLFNALANHQNQSQTGNKVLGFISKSLEPSRFVKNQAIYNQILEDLNKVLIFYGLKFQDDGKFHNIKAATNLNDALTRANELKKKLINRDVHTYVLTYCKAELLENNYFHAVLEACKSIAAKIQQISGLNSDGARLVDEAFGGNNPIIRINSFDTESKKSEQKGFINLAKGLFGTFRNPTAHSPRIEWELNEKDALDLFVLASYIYRRLENSEK